MYDPKGPFTVYCKDCWWGDEWDPMAYGQEYDWNKTFFEQFRELLEKVPRPNLIVSNNYNSDYCNYVADGKDCYLCFGSIAVEDCMYGAPYESKYCVDTYLARECEYCYEVIDCEKLSNSAYTQDCASSFNLFYCFDCKNCQECIACVGLRNKKYHILNEKYDKEEYLKRKQELLSGGRDSLRTITARFEELKKKIPHRFATVLQCTNVLGDHVVQSKNAQHCFDVKRCEDAAYCMRMIDGKDVHDTNYCEFMELSYDYIGFWKTASVKFSNTCGESNDLEYSDFCSASSHLFGSIALKKKSYCIFNKQYTKEEYEKLREKIIAHMNERTYNDKKGRVYKYGEFFPVELSPFAYNESVAQDFFPLSKEDILVRGYRWRDPEEKSYVVTMKSAEIPKRIQDVNDAVLQEIIGCTHEGRCNQKCTSAFKVTSQELQFYRKMNLPLPTLCPNCRHFERLAKRNPFKLWRRQCMCAGIASESEDYTNVGNTHPSHTPNQHCPKKFETSYASERPEIVYCEQCYQAEVA